MKTAILVIQLMFNGQPLNHVQHIDAYGHLNYQVCLDLRERNRKIWAARKNVEIIYIGCPDPWSET